MQAETLRKEEEEEEEGRVVVVVVEEFGGVGDGSGRGGEGDCRARLAPDGGGFIGGGGEAAMMMHYFFFEQLMTASYCGHPGADRRADCNVMNGESQDCGTTGYLIDVAGRLLYHLAAFRSTQPCLIARLTLLVASFFLEEDGPWDEYLQYLGYGKQWGDQRGASRGERPLQIQPLSPSLRLK